MSLFTSSCPVDEMFKNHRQLLVNSFADGTAGLSTALHLEDPALLNSGVTMMGAFWVQFSFFLVFTGVASKSSHVFIFEAFLRLVVAEALRPDAYITVSSNMAVLAACSLVCSQLGAQ